MHPIVEYSLGEYTRMGIDPFARNHKEHQLKQAKNTSLAKRRTKNKAAAKSRKKNRRKR